MGRRLLCSSRRARCKCHGRVGERRRRVGGRRGRAVVNAPGAPTVLPEAGWHMLGGARPLERARPTEVARRFHTGVFRC